MELTPEESEEERDFVDISEVDEKKVPVVEGQDEMNIDEDDDPDSDW